MEDSAPMVEIGFDELEEFADEWLKSGGFRNGMREAFHWAARNEMDIDIVRDESDRLGVQVRLRDTNGQFFTKVCIPRSGLDQATALSKAVRVARLDRIKSRTKASPTARRAA